MTNEEIPISLANLISYNEEIMKKFETHTDVWMGTRNEYEINKDNIQSSIIIFTDEIK